MGRKNPSTDTLKTLFARSGNQCAFTNCNHPIFNDEGLYVAQLCHIKAADGGQRFDQNQTDEERSSSENLLFMCYRHHKETDNVDVYTVGVLQRIKREYELKFTEQGREASREMIRQILIESNFYWKKLSEKTYDLEEMKMRLEFNVDLYRLFDDLKKSIEMIGAYCNMCAHSDSTKVIRGELMELLTKAGLDYSKLGNIPYYENPFVARNWLLHSIGRPNLFTNVSLCIDHLKVKVMEELLKKDPMNEELKSKLSELRSEFEKGYDSAYYVD